MEETSKSLFLFRTLPPPTEGPVRLAKKAEKGKKSQKAKKSTGKNKEKTVKRRSSATPLTFNLNLTKFNILPRGTFQPEIESTLFFVDPSLTKQRDLFKVYSEAIKKYTSGQVFFLFYTTENLKVLRSAIYKLRKIRRAFKYLLHHWLSSRLSPANEEDLFTLEIPKKPVFIIDWPSRKRYVFESSTLMKDITERLLHHDSYFQEPQVPRNPFTNIPLTLSQTLSIWNQLRDSRPSSVFTNFRAARFDMNRFSNEYSIPLQLHALRSAFKDVKNIDVQERIQDFIQYCYDQEAIDCYSTVYAHCLKHYSTNPLVVKWIQICKEYYEAHIVYASNPQKLKAIHDKLFDEADTLLDGQVTLRRLVAAELRIVPRPPVQPRQSLVLLPPVTIHFEEAAAQLTNLLNSL
jgi:hypothetical protein